MDGLCTLYPPKCKFLTSFKWQRKKRTKYFQQYVQDAIMIQAENNNIIGLTEFSNNKIFMIFHVLIHSMMKVSLHLHCVCKKHLLTKQEHFS